MDALEQFGLFSRNKYIFALLDSENRKQFIKSLKYKLKNKFSDPSHCSPEINKLIIVWAHHILCNGANKTNEASGPPKKKAKVNPNFQLKHILNQSFSGR